MRKPLILATLGVLALHSPLIAKELEKEKAIQEARLLSKAFTDVADQAMPATVTIKALKKSSHSTVNPWDVDTFFRRFLGPQQEISMGSGFLISSDGYIVTNSHVIHNASEITVKLSNEQEFSALLKGIDTRTELAILKIDASDLPFLEFGDSDNLKVGEWVIAIGNPLGLEGTLTTGVVSAKGRQDIGIASYEDFIQTTAPMTFGNSGGPLIGLDGKVIGVNTAIGCTRDGGYPGIGFAIPSKIAEHITSQMVEGGSIKRGYLGIVMQPIDKDLAEVLNLDKQEGILIADVTKDSPAEKAGLKVGDIVLEVNHKPIRNLSTLRNEIAMMSPGQELSLRIIRDHKQIVCMAYVGSQDESSLIAADLLQNLGLEVSNITPELSVRLGQHAERDGVVITRVNPGSAAASAGLRSGTIITGFALEGSHPKAIRNVAELDAALQEVGDKKRLVLIARYQNFQRYYILPLR